jgi:O-antigen ligase
MTALFRLPLASRQGRWIVSDASGEAFRAVRIGAERRTRGLGPILLWWYAFLLPVQLPVGTGRLAPSDVFLAVYLLLFFGRVRRVPAGWSVWHPALLSVFGMGLLVAFARNHQVSAYALGTKTAGLAVLMITYAVLLEHCADRRDARRLLGAFLIGVASQALIAVVVYVLQVAGLVVTNTVNFQGARVSGLLVDPNAFGGIVVVALTLHLWTARTAHPIWPWRHGRLTVGVVLFVALALTFSRSAWLAYVLALGTSFLIRGFRGLRPFPLHHLVALAAGFVLLLVVRPGLLSLAVRPDQARGRVGILDAAAHEFASSPIFGIGLGTYVHEHGVIIHNTVAWFGAEMGLVGLVTFAGFLSWYVRGLWRCAREPTKPDAALAQAVLLSIVAMLGLSLGIEALYQRYWWLLFAVAGGIFARSAGERTDEP